MKDLLQRLAVCAAAALGAFAACGAVTVQNVIARQDWPWSGNVNVEFVVSGAGASGGVLLNVAVRAGGGEAAAVPAAAIRSVGDSLYAPGESADAQLYARGGGVKRFAFDPSAVPALAAAGTRADVRVELTAATDENLYKIIDLEKAPGEPGQIEYVTRGALRAGVWGDTADATVMSDWIKTDVLNNCKEPVLAWTGITNDQTYATTKLVLRRIKAGTYRLGSTSSNATIDKSHDSKFTKDYWIGVYELTGGQLRKIHPTRTGDWLTLYKSGAYPAVPNNNNAARAGFSYARIRGACTNETGALTAYAWPDGREVDPDSLMGEIRAHTGIAFDLPTHEQWEAAARGGSEDTSCYDGYEYDANKMNNEEKARMKRLVNCTTVGYSGSFFPVGSLLPNAFGLYDALGNVREYTLDWLPKNAITADSTLTDYPGVSFADAQINTTDNYARRVMKGGCAGQSANGCRLYGMSTENTITYTMGFDNAGIRLCAPVVEGE